MRYFIFTLGCQMNVYDSQRIAAVLKSCGLKPESEGKADLIVVNACSVRQSAVDRIYGKLKKWQDKKVFIAGCLLPTDREKLKKRVDLIFDIKDLSKLPRFLSKITYKYSSELSNYPNEAFVPIMTGCDNFCTYCAVPYTRGREVSRPEKEIVAEVENLIKRGAKEIVLLGQNVNRYRLKPKMQSKTQPFVRLLKKLIKIGNFQIKFLSPNPWDFPEQLIGLIANEPKLSKDVHLPVQSGNDEILRKMNRPYTSAQYLALVLNLKSKIPNLKLSTDIIVGFPGETKKQFENTVKLCQKAKFNKAYIAMYSPRPGTAAGRLFKDNVPQKEKRRRWQVLNRLINKSRIRQES